MISDKKINKQRRVEDGVHRWSGKPRSHERDRVEVLAGSQAGEEECCRLRKEQIQRPGNRCKWGARLHGAFRSMIRNWPFLWVRKNAIRRLWDKEAMWRGKKAVSHSDGSSVPQECTPELLLSRGTSLTTVLPASVVPKPVTHPSHYFLHILPLARLGNEAGLLGFICRSYES